jgi:hypothetical protein
MAVEQGGGFPAIRLFLADREPAVSFMQAPGWANRPRVTGTAASVLYQNRLALYHPCFGITLEPDTLGSLIWPF